MEVSPAYTHRGSLNTVMIDPALVRAGGGAQLLEESGHARMGGLPESTLTDR